MTTATPIPTRPIDRAKEAARYFAPKLIAFLATGLTSSLLIGVLAAFGIEISAVLAVIIVGGLSSVAAYVQRDNLLALAPGQFSLKVLTFIVTSVSATTIVATAAQLGLDLTPWAPVIGVVLTAVASALGFSKADRTTDYALTA